jgi:hypothetical protein
MPQIHAATPLRSFTRLEDERQRAWLFGRHRPKHLAWKRD